MKKLIATLLAALALHTQAEVITIKSPYTPTHKGHAAIYKILENANTSQQQYKFILELNPGGAGVLALTSMDRAPNSSIGLIHASFVQKSIYIIFYKI